MGWKLVRLELASSGEFPRGSVGRSYLIRLPLTHGGSIDDALLGQQPDRATVRRHWTNEPDSAGYFARIAAGYAIKADGGAKARLVRFNDAGVAPGSIAVMTEPDGSEMSFRIASIV